MDQQERFSIVLECRAAQPELSLFLMGALPTARAKYRGDPTRMMAPSHLALIP